MGLQRCWGLSQLLSTREFWHSAYGQGNQLKQIRELLEEFFYRRWRFARTVWTISLRRQFANTMVEDKYLAILLKRLIREKIVLALESRPATQF